MPDTPLQMQLVTTPDLALRFKSMSAYEELARLFELQVVATCDDAAISADDLLGTPASVSLEYGDGTRRWWSGIVAAFGIDGNEGRTFSYRLVLRPWLWLLTRSADVRIFQEMSTPDIVKEIFGKYTGTVTDELSGSYAPRTYCVQYRESDFNFVSRLMEDEGIFYYFRHAENQHELVLADAAGTHVATPGFEAIDYTEDEQALAEKQAINEWHMRHEIQTGKVVVSDYNFETPSTSLLTSGVASSRAHAEAGLEVYDYPAIHATAGDGDNRAKLRLDEASARFTRYTGQGNTPGLAVGARFTLADHPRDDQNADYVVLSTQIDMTQAGGAEAGGDDTLFLCRFAAQAMSDAFRPARTTRKPTVAGPQTALVVGSGDPGDIETDEYGRIKVQFHWDRVGEKNADSSCWLRVASGGAGPGWGMISVPRIGHEVVVAFLEGDPDQPLVVGSVWNAEVKVPYELPANATVSTVKSRSKLGGAAEFNELRFEDKPGSEYVLFQAQKDRFEFVEATFKSEIGVDEHRSVKQHRKEKIEGELHQQVTGVVKHKFGDAMHIDIADKLLVKTGDLWSLKAGADITGESGAAISLKSAADMHLKIGGNWGGVAGQNVHVKGGMNVVIEAGIEITLKAGGSFVTIGPAGVAIKGAMVLINSGGAAGSGNGANPVAPTAPEAPADPEPPEDPLQHR